MLTIKITPDDKGNRRGLLADAELQFTAGPLEGLKLIGFSVWERRTGGGGRNVTFPSRQYTVNGERRSFALLRPLVDASAQNRVRELILEAFAAFEEETAAVR
jgi:hypothetical protein